MIRWTTPTLTCEIEQEAGAPELVFDYLILTITDEKCNEVNKKIDRELVIDNKFEVTLTEEDTRKFESGSKVFAQLNFIWGDTRMATNIIPMNVSKNLYNKELIKND